MDYRLTNNGASISIELGDQQCLLMKNCIGRLSVIGECMLITLTGRDDMETIILDYRDVTSPAFSSAAELMNQISVWTNSGNSILST